MSGSSVDILGQLPVEVGRTILSLLSARDLASCCRVSKAWRSLANDPLLWKRFININPTALSHPLRPVHEGPLEVECCAKQIYNELARGGEEGRERGGGWRRRRRRGPPFKGCLKPMLRRATSVAFWSLMCCCGVCWVWVVDKLEEPYRL